MKKNITNDKYQITERVFADETCSLNSIMSQYLSNKVEKIGNSVYDKAETGAISNKEVA